jgi:ariadne-1
VHICHTACLKLYTSYQIETWKYPLKCPEEKCLKQLINADLAMLLTPEQRKRYEDLELRHAVDQQEDCSWCPNAGCDYAFSFAKGVTEFNCPTCKKKFCLNCRAPYHRGQTCKEFQAGNKRDRDFEAYAKGQKLKQCPFCTQWVEKSAGCDHMKCKCGRDFCYQCGGSYLQCECCKFSRLLLLGMEL